MVKTDEREAYKTRMTKKLDEVWDSVEKSANEIIAASKAATAQANNNKLAEALHRAPNPMQSEAFITVLSNFLRSLKAGSTTPQQIHDYCSDRILRRVGGGSMTSSDQAELNVWAWIVNDCDLRACLS